MNGIFNNKPENQLHGLLAPRSNEPVETAGSLAMNIFHSLFEVNSYDEFSSSNPFAIDYSLYSDCGDTIAYNGFMDAFSNAVSTLSEAGCQTTSFTGGSDCSACSSGGFTSMC